jgi:Ala-tRNA(Pro) deacylase
MTVAAFLEERRCQFERVPHQPTYSAQRMAHEIHVSGREVAKAVLLRGKRDAEFIMAVLPANMHVDPARVSQLIGRKVEMATEFDIAAHCPDCDFGELPPFGSQYGMKTLVDSSLAEDEEIVFSGGTHQEAIRMPFDEYDRIEQPMIASFAVY